jgi:hypothetical protein
MWPRAQVLATGYFVRAPMKKRMENEYPVVRALLVDLGLARP